MMERSLVNESIDLDALKTRRVSVSSDDRGFFQGIPIQWSKFQFNGVSPVLWSGTGSLIRPNGVDNGRIPFDTFLIDHYLAAPRKAAGLPNHGWSD